MAKKRIELGNKVKCKVTGFEGIVTGRLEYLNGCIQLCVKPKCVKTKSKEMAWPEGQYIDIGQLEYVSQGIARKPKNTGGDMDDTPSDSYNGS